MSQETLPFLPTPIPNRDRNLRDAYDSFGKTDWLRWTTSFRKVRMLGKGGQGIVYLSERQGSDGFKLLVALKVFSPENYRDDAAYREDMKAIASVAGRVALIQHDNILDIHDFIEQRGIRIMEMEWVDGFDLNDLLSERMLEASRRSLPEDRWRYLNNVILTPGPNHLRLKPGVAIQVLREALNGLGALHREGIVHGDIKPSNLMIKRTGAAKIIDIGSALCATNPGVRRMWSPTYAAPEVLAGEEATPVSDLCSLGYVLIEMLAGTNPFARIDRYDELLVAKKSLDKRLTELLPADVATNDMLMHLCRKMTNPDPAKRFPSAQAADLDRKGAADFHRQLVKGDLASEYETDLRTWLELVEEH